MIRKFARAAVLLLLVPLAAPAAPPDLPLVDFSGRVRNVNEFLGQGRWTVVAVWSADCPICRREIYHMTFFHDEHKNRDADVLGLSVDGFENRRKAQQFSDDQSLNFPNLLGTRKDASRLSGAAFIGTPTYYFFSPEGRFLTQRVGAITQETAERILAALKTERAQGGASSGTRR